MMTSERKYGSANMKSSLFFNQYPGRITHSTNSYKRLTVKLHKYVKMASSSSMVNQNKMAK